MAMDRVQLLLLGLPLFLFCSDIVNLFTPPPAKVPSHHHHHNHHQHNADRVDSQPIPHLAPDLSVPLKRGVGFGTTVQLSFCSSCSYRGNAVTMKKMLETYFPGINVILSNYPPPFPKQVLSKMVPVVQAGVFAIVMAGEQIFPRLGFIAPPPWYYSLRANRFGSMATTWLLGNMVKNFLQSSGAFEVYCNSDLVFSKLKEHRFPGELELKDLITQRIAGSKLGDDLGNYWSQ